MQSYYRFHDDAQAIEFLRHDTPSPWINYLSNGSMHAFVSQAAGGMLWWKSPLIFRLTRYRFYNLPLDTPGFYIYIREKDGTVWSPSFRPVNTALDDWRSLHQPGKTSFFATKGDLSARLTLFVHPDQDTMIWDLSLTNSSKQKVSLDVFAYVECSQLFWKGETDWGCYVAHQLDTSFDAKLQAAIYYSHAGDKRSPTVYMASSAKVVSHDGDRDQFIGAYRSEQNPLAVEQGRCFNSSMRCGQPCTAIHNKITLPAEKTVRTQYFLGCETGGILNYPATLKTIAKRLQTLREPHAVDLAMAKLDAWWKNHLSAFSASVPDPDTQRMVNIWNPVQCVHTGRYSRSISFYATGIRGLGYRDTCQDMLAIAYRDPAWARRMFHYQLTQQFADGHVVHTCFPEENQAPWTTVHSDDHLWLPMLAYALVAETGDLSLLEEKTPYLADDAKGPSSKTASAWEHLLAAMDFTQTHLGKHGLPLTLKSDWNDIIGKFAKKGQGESVFAAQQYVYCLRLLIELADAINKPADKSRLEKMLNQQIKAIEKHAWDGQWWVRCFDDDGTAVGTRKAKFGKIWINSQSWAVMADVGSEKQQAQAMAAAHKHLDTGIGLAKLWPGYETWPAVKDPFSAYSPGCGENGAIFCHANTWAIIAQAILGNAELAWKYYRQLIPHLAAEKVGVSRYSGEPYAYASNIVGPENSKFGWANVTQVTGTAAWMDVAVTQYLLGIRPTLAGLMINPCIPASWKSFSISRRYRGCLLEIHVENPRHVSQGIKAIHLNHMPLELTQGPILPAQLLEGQKSACVQVVMG